jgi:ankyrin repeat protein
VAIAHAFLAKGADGGARDAQGQTALDLAQARDRDEIAVLLRQAGATE